MMRDRLPDRRDGVTFAFEYKEHTWCLTMTLYSDGRVAEVFVSPPESGKINSSEMADTARDFCVLVSIALQHGVAIQTLRAAITRLHDGAPASIAGKILDELCGG